MAVRAQLLTPWLEPGTLPFRAPKVDVDYSLQSWTDVTGTPAANLPTTPNSVVIEIVCDDATFAAIQADPQYSGGIFWYEAAN